MNPADSPTATFSAAPTGLLEGVGLSCRRGRRLLFEQLDIALPPGSLTWLRGTNGSGKTSLMRMLCGLSEPAAGVVTWNGVPLQKARPQAGTGVVYIGHANALKDDLSLLESLAFLAQLTGLPDAADRARAAVERAGLSAHRHAAVRTLSQGQRRRGALARLALDDAPRTWILDEPYDSLDAASMQTLSDLITAQARRGGAVLLTSHQSVPLEGVREHMLGTPASKAPR
jgi:heme exporter protein A